MGELLVGQSPAATRNGFSVLDPAGGSRVEATPFNRSLGNRLVRVPAPLLETTVVPL